MEQIRYINKGRWLKISVNDVCDHIGRELKLTDKQVSAIRWRFKRDCTIDMLKQFKNDMIHNYPIIDKDFDFYVSNLWFYILRQYLIIDRKINSNVRNLFAILDCGFQPFGIADFDKDNIQIEFIEVE